jgi:hypothetical protein
VRRYLAKTHKRFGRFDCHRCGLSFSGRDAYDRHIVQYATEDWCHLPEEVGLVPAIGATGWRLPAGPLYLDPAIPASGGLPRYPNRAQRVSAAQAARHDPGQSPSLPPPFQTDFGLIPAPEPSVSVPA